MNLRFPHAGYREKIWDHAAGSLIVTEAGAAISDATGALPRSLRLRHGSAQPCLHIPPTGVSSANQRPCMV